MTKEQFYVMAEYNVEASYDSIDKAVEDIDWEYEEEDMFVLKLVAVVKPVKMSKVTLV
jgi:hypothetical protein